MSTKGHPVDIGRTSFVLMYSSGLRLPKTKGVYHDNNNTNPMGGRQAAHLGSPRNIKARFGVRHLIYNPASIPWRLIGTVVALFILFEKAAPMLRLIDPTAAVLDIGSFSLVLFGALALVTFLSVAHWLIGLLWPVIRQYQKHHFHNNFKSLQPWQKIMFYLIIFFGLLYAFVCCFAAVF